MATILDFFKPIATSKRRREEASVSPTSEGPTDAVPTTASSPPNVSSRLSDSGLKASKNNSQSLAASTTDQEERSIELSAYEQKRLAKMAANAQFLQEVGMVSAQLNMTRQLQQEKASRTKPAKRKPKTKPLPEELPVRRSKRIRGEAAPGPQVPPGLKAVAEEEEFPGPDPLEVEASFAESKVLRYSVNGDEDARKAPVSLQDSPERDLVGFQVDAKSYLYDDSLNKTYDISFTPFQDNGLVAAGGHGGLVSIFPFSNSFHQPEIVDGFVDDPGAHIPLMSFKAHNGWVSAVSLARSIQAKANLLLTASNDASVKLWDLNHSSALLNTPKLVFSNTKLHDKGIFGMDVCGDSVLTCSKDKTVALSRFRDDTGQLEMTQRFEEHMGVVKCVRFARCNPQIFASAGNDRELRVFDVRVAMNPNVVTIGGAHTRAINSVQFHPTDDNLLMSAGFDPDFYLFDLRNTSIPVCTFHQRDDTSKGIFHPIFVRDGVGVVAARGHYLSLYRTSDGVAISRGYINAAATCIAADPFYDRIAIAQGGKLQFADAKWKSTV